MPIAGGSPKRLTWHSADDLVEGFDHRGRVVFSSQSDVQTARDVHLFAIDPTAALPERLPIPRGVDADISPDGRTIAYAQTPPQAQWKAYRGGTVSRIAIMSFADHGLQRVPQPPSRCNDLNPMWIGGKLYFDSDRNGEFNLHSFDPASGEVRQVTSYQDFPVVNANVGDGKVIFEQAGHLRVFDPATSNTTTLRVAVASDLRETRPRRVSNVDYVRNITPSPDLDQVALEYRGEIVTVPAQKGAPIRNLTQSTGANDRAPAWSPGGSKIAWFSDESGDYALYVADRNGAAKPRRIAIERAPASIAISSGRPMRSACRSSTIRTACYVLELESGRATRIAENDYFGHTPFISHNWSPDSQWLAYTQNSNGLIQVVHVYSIAQRKALRDHRRTHRGERAGVRSQRPLPVRDRLRAGRAGEGLVLAGVARPDFHAFALRDRAAQGRCVAAAARGRDSRRACERHRQPPSTSTASAIASCRCPPAARRCVACRRARAASCITCGRQPHLPSAR